MEYRGNLYSSNKLFLLGLDHYQMSELHAIFDRKMERISKYIIIVVVFFIHFLFLLNNFIENFLTQPIIIPCLYIYRLGFILF